MKKIELVFVALCVVTFGASAKGGHTGSSGGFSGSYAVSGQVRSSGTYVAPSHATNPNATKADNWSTEGNVKPYTGKPGTK